MSSQMDIDEIIARELCNEFRAIYVPGKFVGAIGRILAALNAGEYVIVKKEITPEMEAAFEGAENYAAYYISAERAWDVMLAAATKS